MSADPHELLFCMSEQGYLEYLDELENADWDLFGHAFLREQKDIMMNIIDILHDDFRRSDVFVATDEGVKNG